MDVVGKEHYGVKWMRRQEKKLQFKLIGEERALLLGSKKPSNPDTDGWSKQLERWGVDTSQYRRMKRNTYQARRRTILLERKVREVARADIKTPQGRINHLVDQQMRIVSCSV